MKNSVSLLAIFCLLSLTCCQQGTKLPENYQAQVCEELSQLNVKYFEAWDNEDLDLVMSFLDKEFINMFSYGPATNYEENREGFRNIFDTYLVENVRYDRTECLVDHNMAFETGLFEQKWISNDGKDTLSFKMRGISVWKKDAEGNWKMFRLIAQQ